MFANLKSAILRNASKYKPAKISSAKQNQIKKISPKKILSLSEPDLELLNKLLPWTTFINLKNGLKFGVPYSAKKRNKPQTIPDRRIIELDNRYGLADKTVLEVGCLEGIHTIGLAAYAKSVIAVDSRIENVVKSLVRVWAYGLKANLFVWDVEQHLEKKSVIDCDILHHNGVLYHLQDPAAHLKYVLSSVKQAVMLDTHAATDETATEEYESATGKRYRFKKYGEKGRADPFSGMYKFSRWLLEKDLVEILKDNGFSHVDVAERRDERNGYRVLIFAHR